MRTLKRSNGLAHLDAGTETFAEFASEWWELYAKPNLERATLSNYASVFNKHLLRGSGTCGCATSTCCADAAAR